MKRVVALTLALTAAVSAAAQDLPLGASGVTRIDGRTVWSRPRTELNVELTVTRTTVLRGPYARFAQKYFGSIAPLADKTVWTVENARITAAADDVAAARGLSALPPAAGISFPRVPVDKLSASDAPLEAAALEAAQTVYSLRRHRLDIVSGAAEDGAYGGTQAVLNEISRLEREYLALFFGLQRTDTFTVAFRVVPESGRTTYIVSRFSESDGLLSANDLAGQPLTLELRPQQPDLGALPRPRLNRSGQPVDPVDTYAVPAETLCTVADGKRELGRAVVPVFQLGRTAVIPRVE